MTEPQPIETAPKDGTPILVGRAGHRWEIAWWEEESVWLRYINDGPGWCCYISRSDTHGPSFDPTHWLPLPAPPEYRNP